MVAVCGAVIDCFCLRLHKLHPLMLDVKFPLLSSSSDGSLVSFCKHEGPAMARLAFSELNFAFAARIFARHTCSSPSWTHEEGEKLLCNPNVKIENGNQTVVRLLQAIHKVKKRQDFAWATLM